MHDWFALEGSPSPLGVTWIEDEAAYNFALYSRHATAVTLLLYSEIDLATPTYEHRLNPLLNKSGRIWHCRLRKSSIPDARYYAYQVAGPKTVEEGHRFDARKVLLDPYARCVCFPTRFSRAAASSPGSNAGRAPLGLITSGPRGKWAEDRGHAHTSDLVIYELHVRGFTKRENSGVPMPHRGTFLGVVEKIPYLKELGITAVELLPVMQQDPQEGSYWGYMPLNFFSPHHEYASAGKPFDALNEFRMMVRALHEAGIEVLLDVVYNHTAEGNEEGPTYSYRGIDNTTYYLLEPDRCRYRNDSGTGNTLNCANPYVRKMILDSMRFWREQMRVDGFRFDLASIFTRNEDGTINLSDPPVIAEIGASPELENLRLIAEAWDPATYQLGQGFPGISWLQWNGQFRDDVRAFLRGDADMVPKLMSRIYGSCDIFPDDLANSYRPYQSVNFVTCHDGFCLYDLVSYGRKHNEANGHGNTDGTDCNLSWNCGWEGDVGAPASVLEVRRQQVKNFCTLLFLSNGTPMFCAGDEFMNTQRGNNNPYNQDNETTWLNWDLLDQNRDIFRFFSSMIAFRKSHPSISRSRYWRDDIRWYGTSGGPDLGQDSRCLAYFLDGAVLNDADIYVMINGSPDPVAFIVQEGHPGEWRRVIDTSLPSPNDICDPGTEFRLSDSGYVLKSRSIVVLIRRQ
ncbi:MAG TPA: isoamylase [Alloacidobacterium sp.]|jgi:glycogen operon protein|nr:isoamylase [Alloacidobacterium sp.]